MAEAAQDIKNDVISNFFSNAFNGNNKGTGGDDLISAAKVWLAKLLSDYTGRKASEIGYRIAKNRFNKPDIEAAAIGRKTEMWWRVGLPVLTGSVRSIRNVSGDIALYGKLSRQFYPSINSFSRNKLLYPAFFSTDLEVIRNARRNTAKKLKNSIKAECVAVLAMLPVAASSLVDKLIDDVHRASKTREEKNNNEQTTSEPSDNPYAMLDSMRYKSAEKIERRLRRLIDKLDPENHGLGANAKMGIDLISQTLTGKSIDHYTGENGPYTLLSDIKSGILGKYDLVGGGVSSFLRRKIGVKGKDNFDKPMAYKMIFALEEALAQNPSLTNVTGLPGQRADNIRLAEYIEDILRQHQQDCGRADIPDILEDELQEACSIIAEAMTDPNRMLHPQSLVKLVDKKYGIMKYDGKVASGVMGASELAAYIQEIMHKAPAMSRRNRLSAEEYFANSIFTPEAFAHSWSSLTEEEQFVFSTFFPDEILENIGVSDEELAELRRNGNEFWRETVESLLEEIQMLNSADLKQIGVNSKQIDEIRHLIKAHMQGRSDKIDQQRHSAMNLTAQIAVAMDSKDDTGFISRILQRAIEKKRRKQLMQDREDHKSFVEQISSGSSSNGIEV